MNKYLSFCRGMVNGEIPFKERYYALNINNGNNGTKTQDLDDDNINIISPTQSTVEKARSEIEEENNINIDDISLVNQSGGSSSKKKGKNTSKKNRSKTSKPKKKVTKKTKNSKTKGKKASKKKKQAKRPVWI